MSDQDFPFIVTPPLAPVAEARDGILKFTTLLDPGLADPESSAKATVARKWPVAYGFWIIMATCGTFWAVTLFLVFSRFF